MLPISFSWRMFLTTVAIGLGIVIPTEVAYASFVSQAVNQKNSISSGYWITPTVTSYPTATLIPVSTATPTPTEIIEPPVTGTPVPTETLTPIPTNTITPSPTGSQVVINEYMPLPLSGTTDWVEIYNKLSTGKDISGWKLKDSGTSSMGTISQDTIINGNSYLVISVGSRLNNSSDDQVRLFDASDNLIDSTSYLGTDVETEKSFGRETDGSGIWKKCSTSTKNLTNNGSC